MTEINIILDTDFQEIDDNILKNDKELFYEILNENFNLYKFNSYSKFLIPYNQIINDFISNDDYLEYDNDLNNIKNINIKKMIFKKILHFYNPIIKKIIIVNKNGIIDKNSINLNFPLQAKIINPNRGNSTVGDRIISNNQYFIINGLYNKSTLNNNLLYKLDKYKYIKLQILKLISNIINNNVQIFYSNIKYNNISLINDNFIDNVDIEHLKELYLLYLNYSKLYYENEHLINNKQNLYLDNNKLILGTESIVNKSDLQLVDNNYYNNYILQFNKFLNYKISNYYNNHAFYAFQATGLLDLYEQILIYSIDNNKVKNMISKIIQENNNNKNLYLNQKIINEYKLKYIEIEYLTRKKFPNLFNPNSKEVIFHKFKQFNLDELPKKYKDIVLIEYKKLQTYKLQNLKNKCKHKQLINSLAVSQHKYKYIKDIEGLIQGNKEYDSEYYKCILCSYNLICPHVLEYYNLLFSKNKFNQEHDFTIRQHIINKFMTNAKVNMIYYCKICGEELGRSLDLEQNIEFQDKVKLNTTEYTDNTLEIIRNNTIHIVYSYIIFNKIDINITKKYLINYIINSITSNINIIEKSLRKSKNYNEEQIINILDFNSIIFIYATLIFIMSKYTFLAFTIPKSIRVPKYTVGSNSKLNKNIIIPKQVEIKSNKDLLNLIKIRFKEAYDLIISTNNILLFKLKYNNQYDKIKELLLKTYGIVAKNDNMVISDNIGKISNSIMLLNSNIFNYLSYIKYIETSYNKNSDFIPSNISIVDNLNTFNSYNKKESVNSEQYVENVLNIKNINSNKYDNLFKFFKSPILDNTLLENVLTNNKINNYNEYKILSFNLFYYHIHNELYNLPIYNYISLEKYNFSNSKFINDNVYLDKLIDVKNNDHYNIYIKLTHIIKTYEIELINKNINYNLYPISFIKLNNSRYYYKKNINLNLFFCSQDGYLHKFNIYTYNQIKNNKNNNTDNNEMLEFNQKDIDKNIDKITQLTFKDYKCSKCNKLKSELLNQNENKIISNLINENNDKDGFFNLYLNVCPITINNNNKEEYQYHQFNYDNKTNIVDIKCNICKIKYIDLLNKNNNVFNQFSKEYYDYKNQKINDINKNLDYISIKNNNLYNININKQIDNNINKLKILSESTNIIEYINNIEFDTIIVNFSKIFKINIIYLQKIGLTEGYSYSDINNINDNYNILRINKLISYFRTISIYYNKLKYHHYNIKNNDDIIFIEIINKLYDIQNIKLKLDTYLPDISYNILDLLNMLKINNDEKYITHFLIKLILSFIININDINNSKLDNILDSFIEFIVNKILKYDELFTNYNYSQLKQMFTEDKINNTQFEEYIDNSINDDDDDDELFGYNDLNIQFDDEDPLDE